MTRKIYESWENYDEWCKTVRQQAGEPYAGCSIGVLVMDLWYPKVPGNVANSCTYDYPVSFKVISQEDCNTWELMKGDPRVLEPIIEKLREFEREGVRAVACACGYFARFQKELAASVNIPIWTSSLIQLPWIKIGLKDDQKIGIICAIEELADGNLFNAIGIEADRLVIKGMSKNMDKMSGFEGIMNNAGPLDNGLLADQMAALAREMVEQHPEIGAFLIECSDLCPYSLDVQKAVSLPVFDFITMINWMHQGVSQKRYYGIM